MPTVWMQHSSPSTRVEKHAAHASRTTGRMLHRRTRLGVRLHVSSLNLYIDPLHRRVVFQD